MILTFACLFGLFAAIGNGPEELTISLAIAMFVCAALAHLWVVVSIRCPACKRRPAWFVMTTAGKQWLTELWRGSECPACGNSGRGTQR